MENHWKFEDVDNAALGEDDHYDIIKALNLVAGRWRQIGTAMRLEVRQLDKICSGSRAVPS